jgi:hypothetical protein
MEIEGENTNNKNYVRYVIFWTIICVIMVAADIGVWMLDALVIQKLWNWFIYPTTNVYFTYWAIFGAMLIPSVFAIAPTLRNQVSEEKEIIDTMANLAATEIIHALCTLVIWGIGAIIA